jgi:hypothetical protein
MQNYVTWLIQCFPKDGVKITSGKLKEWCGLDVGSSSEALGVEDWHSLYLLESPHPEYAAHFFKSKAPVSFASTMVHNFEQRRDLTLEALASKFLVSNILNFIDLEL